MPAEMVRNLRQGEGTFRCHGSAATDCLRAHRPRGALGGDGGGGGTTTTTSELAAECSVVRLMPVEPGTAWEPFRTPRGLRLHVLRTCTPGVSPRAVG